MARLEPPPSGATVRMYRQGLGDCFLLAFPGAGSEPFYVLVDCGVLKGTADGAEKLRQVAEDVHRSTGGRLDVLAVTHEHYDHVSGFLFKDALEVFRDLRIGELWLAWTEDPEDADARSIRDDRRLRLRGLHQAVRQLRAAGRAEAGAIRHLLDFHGELLDVRGELGARCSVETERALANATGLVERRRDRRYWRPGELVEPAGAPGLRVYFLGPPRGPLLYKSDPSAEHSEVYEKRLAVNEERNFLIAALGDELESRAPEPHELEMQSLSFPFNRAWWTLDVEGAKNDPFFQEWYGFGEAAATDLDQHAGQPWRRIDASWLERTADLALQLDNHTNNTSLVMAIELVASGKVLLLPGDAQVGSWLSWHQPQPLRWTVGGGKAVSAADLLARTVLYKVGHHGSHNATLGKLGLELMSSDLVAMIPVDEKKAREPKGGNRDGWNMPFPPLLEALERKTGGRILRSDVGIERSERMSDAEWGELRAAVEEDGGDGGPLASRYLQYSVADR